ncbi:MAG: hypothetical protein V9G19_07015 [Tetrasphaera sp.]
MRYRTAALTAAASAGLLVAGCGGGDSDPTTTSPSTSAAAPSSSTPSAASETSSSSSSGGGLIGNLEACSEAATTGLAIAGVGLDALSGNFDQADFDKTFASGTADKLPEELRDEYAAVEEAAKKLIGKDTTEAVDLSNDYTATLEKYTNAMTKVCTG